ncbi:hypothetical protein [Nocardia inohanensis]|uniref:hypothetical protein n=1 Tax=Nocardia inohanensis TaxID=209246 RepID=UPI0012FA47F1|nr:hypothetical protein [Nocardia inohanensis]
MNRADEPEQVARGGFDNPLSLDPCSYIEPKTFAAVADRAPQGGPWVRVRPAGFSICTAEVMHSGLPVTINLEARHFESHETSYTATKTTKRGSVEIADLGSNGLEHCPQLLIRPDGAAVRLSASMDSPRGANTRETVCEIRDAATDAAVSALTRGSAKSLEYPADSLAGISPCYRFTAANLQSTVGQSPVTKHPSELPYTCEWEVGNATVHLEIGLKPKSETGGFGDETLEGHQANAMQLNTTECIVQTLGRGWEPWPGSHANYPGGTDADSAAYVELATLSVRGTTDDGCGKAAALATILWRQLPKA